MVTMNYRIIKRAYREDNGDIKTEYLIQESNGSTISNYSSHYKTINTFKTLKQAKTYIKKISVPLPEDEVIEI